MLCCGNSQDFFKYEKFHQFSHLFALLVISFAFLPYMAKLVLFIPQGFVACHDLVRESVEQKGKGDNLLRKTVLGK